MIARAIRMFRIYCGEGTLTLILPAIIRLLSKFQLLSVIIKPSAFQGCQQQKIKILKIKAKTKSNTRARPGQAKVQQQ